MRLSYSVKPKGSSLRPAIEWSSNMSNIHSLLFDAPTACDQIHIEKIETIFITAEHNQTNNILVSTYQGVKSNWPLTIAPRTAYTNISCYNHHHLWFFCCL